MSALLNIFDITHKEGVRRIANWLRNSKRCSIVIAELRTLNQETPDVIGWLGGGTASSILVEVKVNRSDFLADKKKIFRQEEIRGMGDSRYYAAPAGVLSGDDVPEGWGLLEIRQHQIKEIKRPDHDKPADKRCEMIVLMSAMRRLEISTAVFVRQDIEPTDNGRGGE